MFKFIHAADIHLDSPLRGLERYEGAPVDEIRQATRRAFENLVQLAIDERVAFVLIAGDLYDGDWKDYNTGLYFLAQMTKLREAGIPVYLITGNHDAANKMTKALRLPDNVHQFSIEKPQTVHLDDWNVALHGQGFATAAVKSDLSAEYPSAESGWFNIGLLHTCATGREGHESYAPCTVSGLQAKEYDYWALGHIHTHEELQPPGERPIVFSGNVQGRHIRETGPKGCTLVTVDDRGGISSEFRTLDVFRWQRCEVDASETETGDDVLQRFSEELRGVLEQAEDRSLAVRVEITGACRAHESIAAQPQYWINQIRGTAIEEGPGRVWVEKVKLCTTLQTDLDSLPAADGPIGELIQFVEELRDDEGQLKELAGELSDLRKKLPTELLTGQEGVNFDDPAVLRTVVDQVEQMLIGRLLSNRAAS